MIFPTPHQAFWFVAEGAARQPANGQWTRNNRVNPVALIDVYKMAVQHAGTSGTTFFSPERRRHCCRRRLPATSRPGTTRGHGLRRQRGCRHRLRPDGRLPPDRRLHSARQAMLVATVGTGADADERRRLVTGHLRLKAQAGILGAKAATGQLTDVRLRFFDRCDAFLGVNASRSFSVKRQTPPRPTSPASLPLWKSTDTRH
jgi:hypothetical protein